MRQVGRCILALAALATGASFAESVSHADVGVVLKTITVGAGADAIVVAVRSGHVFVAEQYSNDSRMLDAATGRVLRTTAAGDYHHSGFAGVVRPLPFGPMMLAVDAGQERVYVGTQVDAALILDARSGRVLGTPRTPGLAPATALAADHGRLFVVGISPRSAELQLDVLDRHGRLLRVTGLGGHPPAINGGAGYHGGGIAIDARTGRIFIGSMTRNVVYSVRLSDGASLGATRVGAFPAPPVAEAVDEQAGHVFVVSEAGASVYMCDARTGVVLRRARVAHDPVALAVDAQTHRAFILSRGPLALSGAHSGAGHGSVGVIDTRTGALLSTVGVGVGPRAVAIDEPRGRVFVVNTGALNDRGAVLDRGSVSVLDARSGVVRVTFRVGLMPTAVAVDDRTARAFVISSRGRLAQPHAKLAASSASIISVIDTSST